MHKKSNHFWNNTVTGKLFIYHLIFFFTVTPFLSNCSSSGNSNNKTPYSTEPLADDVENQNKSAETAISDVVDMADALTTGSGLIEDTFGTTTPDLEEIEDYILAHPEEADTLMAQLKQLDSDLQSAAESFTAAVKELKGLESDISDSLESSSDENEEVVRSTRSIGLVGGALVILTVIGTLAAAGKGAADAIHECDNMPECNPMPGASDSQFAECMKKRADKLACIIQKWPKAATDAIKGTISNGVTTVSSWAAGIKEWKTVQFLIEAYSTYDDVDSIHKAFGIRRCDETSGDKSSNGSTGRALKAYDMDDLTPDDIYIGTSDNGSFHNVPKGEWTFLLFEEGHLRKTSQCVDATGTSPIQPHVTLVPSYALSDDDKDGYSEIQGDCNDQNATIHPKASETCTDGIDNDCDMLIDCYDSQCEEDASCEEDSSDVTLSVNVSIPGYGSFSPNFKVITLGQCDDGTEHIFPSIYASSGKNYPDFTKSDVFTVIFNNDMGTGLWGLDFGPCDTPIVFFSIKNIIDQADGTPVVFGSESGSITLTAYGTEFGDRLSGSFDVDVSGDQCLDSECEDEKTITGTITGTFSGVITPYNLKSLKVRQQPDSWTAKTRVRKVLQKQ